MTDSTSDPRRKGLFKLIADLPSLLITLIKGELELLQKEVTGKLKQAGIGIGLLVVAGVFAFFAVGLLLTAAVAGLIAAGLPAWASALIIAGALLLIAGILVAVAVSLLKRGVPLTPEETIDSVKQDVRTIQGIGK